MEVVSIIAIIISTVSLVLSIVTLVTSRGTEPEPDFSETEKGQLRQVLNILAFDGGKHEN